MLDYIPLKQSFFRDSRIIKLLMENKHREIIIILRVLLILSESIDTKNNCKPMLKLEDLDVLSYCLNESDEVVQKVIDYFFKINKNDSENYIYSEYLDDFYLKLKEQSDRQRARRQPKKTENENKPEEENKENEKQGKLTAKEIENYTHDLGYKDYKCSPNDLKLFSGMSDWKNEIRKMIELAKTEPERATK